MFESTGKCIIQSISRDTAHETLSHFLNDSAGWELEEPGIADTSKFDMLMPTVVRPKGTSFDMTSDLLPHEVGIIRQLTFSSALARMSVITRTLDGQQFTVYTKGAPEKMEDLCTPDSIPASFHPLLKRFTVQGFRVIALAYR